MFCKNTGKCILRVLGGLWMVLGVGATWWFLKLVWKASRSDAGLMLFLDVLLAAVAMLTVVGGYGLLRLRRWGRGLILGSAGVTLMLALDCFGVFLFAHGFDWTNTWFLMLCLVSGIALVTLWVCWIWTN